QQTLTGWPRSASIVGPGTRPSYAHTRDSGRSRWNRCAAARMRTVSSPPPWPARIRRGNCSGSTNGVSGGWSCGLIVPVIAASLAEPRRARRRLSLSVASFDPDRVSRRHAIGVMCADSILLLTPRPDEPPAQAHRSRRADEVGQRDRRDHLAFQPGVVALER